MKLATTTVLLVIALAVTRGPAPAGAAAFCSMDPFASLAYDSTYFIGVATGDVLPGGAPLRLKPLMAPDSVVISPANGQVVNATRISKNAPLVMRDGLARSGNKVLMVPWSYGPDCTPHTWNGPWVAAGTRGLFSGRLRPREKWVNDIPTFDVFASLSTPYPSAIRSSFQLRGGTPLTADELMSFYESLPRLTTTRRARPDQLKKETEQFKAMVEWADRHPELAGRPPVATKLAIARRQLGLMPYLSRESPVAGTWRFTVFVPGYDSATIYGRTQLLPNSLLTTGDGTRHSTEVAGAAPFGYYLLTVLTKNVPDLDIPRWPPPTRQAHLPVSFEPELITADSTVWAGGIDIFVGRDALPDGSPLRERFDYFRNALRGVVDPGRPRYAGGRIVLLPDGTARLERIYRDSDSVYAVIRGERISTQTWKPQ